LGSKGYQLGEQLAAANGITECGRRHWATHALFVEFSAAFIFAVWSADDSTDKLGKIFGVEISWDLGIGSEHRAHGYAVIASLIG
jgi:hypothetical protein